jgi:chromosome segregation protein
VSDLATARRIFAQLEQEQIGSIILRIAELGGRRPPTELPPGLRPATAALDRIDEGHPARAILGSCYVADDLGAFLEFWRAHPGFPSLPSRRARARSWTGGASSPAATPTRRSTRTASSSAKSTCARPPGAGRGPAPARRAARPGRSAERRIAAAEQALEERRGRSWPRRRRSRRPRPRSATPARGSTRRLWRATRMEQELAALEQARLRRRRAGRRRGRALRVRGRGRRAAKEDRGPRGAAHRGARGARRQARGACPGRLELAERRQKVEVLDRGLGEMERRREQINDLLLQRQQEIEAWTEPDFGAGGRGVRPALERSPPGRHARGGPGAGGEDPRRSWSRSSARSAPSRPPRPRSASESDAAHAELSAHEVQLAEGRQRAAFLAEEVAPRVPGDLAAVDWKATLWRADDEPRALKPLDLDEEEERSRSCAARGRSARRNRARRTWRRWTRPTGSAVKAEVDALRQRMGGMGAVNLVAIEEYSELKQRHDFLGARATTSPGRRRS